MTKSKKIVSKREAILVIVLILIATSLGYYHFRFKKWTRDIKIIKNQAEASRGKLDKFKLTKEPRVSNRNLERQIEKVEGALEQVQSRTAQLETNLISLDSPQVIQRQKAEISALARRHGVLVMESKPYHFDPRANIKRFFKTNRMKIDDINNLNLIYYVMEENYIKRPVRKMKVRTRYGNLIKFMEDLSALSSQVTIIQMRMEPIEATTMQGRQQVLEADLVLLL